MANTNKPRKHSPTIANETDMEREIALLSQSEAVKLARAEVAYKYRRRQYLYQLRYMEKRGRELMALGITSAEDIENGALERLGIEVL